MMKRCTTCDGDLGQATKELELLEIDGHRFVAMVPIQRCNTCGAELVSGPVLERMDLRIARILADAGIRSGAAFKVMRKALGLSGVRLAELLDVAPETISRWETGKRDIDRATLATVGALLKDALLERSDTLDHLRALHKPNHLGATVRLDLTGS